MKEFKVVLKGIEFKIVVDASENGSRIEVEVDGKKTEAYIYDDTSLKLCEVIKIGAKKVKCGGLILGEKMMKEIDEERERIYTEVKVKKEAEKKAFDTAVAKMVDEIKNGIKYPEIKVKKEETSYLYGGYKTIYYVDGDVEKAALKQLKITDMKNGVIKSRFDGMTMPEMLEIINREDEEKENAEKQLDKVIQFSTEPGMYKAGQTFKRNGCTYKVIKTWVDIDYKDLGLVRAERIAE